jgi:hypothetical protein
VREWIELADGSEGNAFSVSYDEIVGAGTDQRLDIERAPTDLLFMYTGGTTGLPKGVLWKQGTLLRYGIAATYGMDGEAEPDALDSLAADAGRRRYAGCAVVPLLTSPLVHATAVHQANTACSVGGTVVLLERGHVDGDAVCATIQRERPTLLAVVGDTILRRIVRALEAAEARGEPYDLVIRRITTRVRWSAPTPGRVLRAELEFYGAQVERSCGFVRVGACTRRARAHFRLGAKRAPARPASRDVVRVGHRRVLAMRSISGAPADPRRATTYRTIDERHVVLATTPAQKPTAPSCSSRQRALREHRCEKNWPRRSRGAQEHPHIMGTAVIGIPDGE